MRFLASLPLLFLLGCSSIRPLYNSELGTRYDENITIKIIEERQGQLLRNNLLNIVRDFPNNLSGTILDIKLKRSSEGVLYDKSGTSNLLLLTHSADVKVIEKSTGSVLISENIEIPQSINVSNTSGEIFLQIYSDYEVNMLKRLAHSIFDTINMKMKKIKEDRNGESRKAS